MYFAVHYYLYYYTERKNINNRLLNFEQDSKEKYSPIRQKKIPERTLIKTKGKIPDNALNGTVVASTGKTYIVETSNNNELFDCFPGGTIITSHKDTTIISVGDEVTFITGKKISKGTGLNSGTIIKVEKRLSKLSRKGAGKEHYEHVLASNVEKLIITMSTIEPIYNRRLIDRFLIAAEEGDLEPVICINKIDLFDSPDMRNDFKVYQELGIPIFFLSARTGDGFDVFYSYLKNIKSVLSGQSGSGKSTIINRILGSSVQKVMEISEKTSKGKHATSFVRMFDLPEGGKLIDTPGIREFALWGLPKDEIPYYFHDLMQFQPECRFIPCTHTHEPDCAVKEAVEEGKLDAQRYESYLNLYFSME